MKDRLNLINELGIEKFDKSSLASKDGVEAFLDKAGEEVDGGQKTLSYPAIDGNGELVAVITPSNGDNMLYFRHDGKDYDIYKDGELVDEGIKELEDSGINTFCKEEDWDKIDSSFKNFLSNESGIYDSVEAAGFAPSGKDGGEFFGNKYSDLNENNTTTVEYHANNFREITSNAKIVDGRGNEINPSDINLVTVRVVDNPVDGQPSINLINGDDFVSACRSADVILEHKGGVDIMVCPMDANGNIHMPDRGIDRMLSHAHIDTPDNTIHLKEFDLSRITGLSAEEAAQRLNDAIPEIATEKIDDTLQKLDKVSGYLDNVEKIGDAVYSRSIDIEAFKQDIELTKDYVAQFRDARIAAQDYADRHGGYKSNDLETSRRAASDRFESQFAKVMSYRDDSGVAKAELMEGHNQVDAGKAGIEASRNNANSENATEAAAGNVGLYLAVSVDSLGSNEKDFDEVEKEADKPENNNLEEEESVKGLQDDLCDFLSKELDLKPEEIDDLLHNAQQDTGTDNEADPGADKDKKSKDKEEDFEKYKGPEVDKGKDIRISDEKASSLSNEEKVKLYDKLEKTWDDIKHYSNLMQKFEATVPRQLLKSSFEYNLVKYEYTAAVYAAIHDGAAVGDKEAIKTAAGPLDVVETSKAMHGVNRQMTFVLDKYLEGVLPIRDDVYKDNGSRASSYVVDVNMRTPFATGVRIGVLLLNPIGYLIVHCVERASLNQVVKDAFGNRITVGAERMEKEGPQDNVEKDQAGKDDSGNVTNDQNDSNDGNVDNGDANKDTDPVTNDTKNVQENAVDVNKQDEDHKDETAKNEEDKAAVKDEREDIERDSLKDKEDTATADNKPEERPDDASAVDVNAKEDDAPVDREDMRDMAGEKTEDNTDLEKQPSADIESEADKEKEAAAIEANPNETQDASANIEQEEQTDITGPSLAESTEELAQNVEEAEKNEAVSATEIDEASSVTNIQDDETRTETGGTSAEEEERIKDAAMAVASEEVFQESDVEPAENRAAEEDTEITDAAIVPESDEDLIETPNKLESAEETQEVGYEDQDGAKEDEIGLSVDSSIGDTDAQQTDGADVPDSDAEADIATQGLDVADAEQLSAINDPLDVEGQQAEPADLEQDTDADDGSYMVDADNDEISFDEYEGGEGIPDTISMPDVSVDYNDTSFDLSDDDTFFSSLNETGDVTTDDNAFLSDLTANYFETDNEWVDSFNDMVAQNAFQDRVAALDVDPATQDDILNYIYNQADQDGLDLVTLTNDTSAMDALINNAIDATQTAADANKAADPATNDDDPTELSKNEVSNAPTSYDFDESDLVAAG